MSPNHQISSLPPTRLPGNRQGADVRQLLNVILDRAWIILSVFVVVGLLTFGYLQRSPRIYAATATLQVEQQEQRILKFERVVQEDLRSLDILRTIVQTLKTRQLLERVAGTNNLATDARFVGLGKLPTDIPAMLDGMTTVRLRTGTRLIDVTVEHTSVDLAAKLANSIVEQFIRLGYEQEAAVSDVATENLMREAGRLKRKLRDSEIALQRYMEDSRSVSLQAKQDIVIPKLKDLSAKLTETKSARIRQEADYMAVKEAGTNVTGLLALSAVANDPTVTGLQLNISKLESDFATVKQRYRAEHPKYIQITTQLGEIRGSLNEAVLRVQQFLAANFESSKSAEHAFEAAVQEQEQAAMALNKQAIQYSVLSREVESDRSMYDAVLSRVKETSLTKDLASYKVRVVEPAVKPRFAIKPQKTSIMIRGLILGLVAGIGLAFGINSLDSSFKTADQVEEMIGLPVLGALPVVPDLEEAETQIVLDENSSAIHAEAFRSMRASLSMLGRTEERRVFLFTSAMPQEGKTFCSVNFAMSLAQQGLRTLLVDCDLRRPNVEKAMFGTRRSTCGVTDFLAGQKEFSSIVNSTGFSHELFFVGSGSHAPNPSELLAQGQFSQLIAEALKEFDRVVIDSAPLQAVSDTLLILQGVQTVSLTIRLGKTPRKSVMRSLQMLKHAGAPIAGVVLNFLKRQRGGGYYYNYYYAYGSREEHKETPKAERESHTVSL